MSPRKGCISKKDIVTASVSDMGQLDALMRSVHGCTCNEFMAKWYQAGYEQGIKNGKRLAKGKSEWPKSRGHPKLFKHEILVLQFIAFVNARMSEDGISLPAAVSKYRDVIGRAWKELKSSIPSQEQLLSLYKRVEEPEAISDDARRAYDILEFGSPDLPST